MKPLLRIIFPVLMLIYTQLNAQHVYNYAGKFNGTNSMVAYYNTPETNLSAGYTIESWVYCESTPGVRQYIFADTSGVALAIGTSGNINFTYNKTSTALLDAFPLDKWTHVAVTYDLVTAKVYINGALTYSINSPGYISAQGPYAYIGGFSFNNTTLYPFKGMMDDFRVWRRAKTLYEINRDMYLSIANMKPTGAYEGLALSLRFDRYGTLIDEAGDYNNIGFVGINWIEYSNTSTGRTSYNSSLVLDGSTSYCAAPPHAKQNVTSALTLEGWAKMDKTGPRNTVQEVVSKTSTGSSYSYRMYIRNDSTAVFAVNTGNEYKLEAVISNPFAWNHIAGTYNAISGKMNLYINGTLAKTEIKTPASIQSNQSDSLYIGKCGMSSAQDTRFKGQLDEIRLWAEKERTADEIKQYMHQGINFKNEPVQNACVYGFDGRTDDVSESIYATPSTALSFFGNAYMRSSMFYSPVYGTSPLLWQSPGNFMDNTWNFSAKPLNVPVNGTVTDSIYYASNGTVQAPQVMVMLNSENIHKIKLKLTAPDGTTVQLTPNQTSSAPAKSDLMTIFTDNSSLQVTYDSASLAPYSANAKPYQPLSVLNGKNRKGWWKLSLEPAGEESEGRLIKWGVQNSVLTTIEENGTAPKNFNLRQNYPNPFNPSTKIKFDIPANVGAIHESPVKLTVYNSLGKQVGVLVNENLQPGSYEYTFDGTGLASGVYFYKLQAGDFIETKRMLMIK